MRNPWSLIRKPILRLVERCNTYSTKMSLSRMRRLLMLLVLSGAGERGGTTSLSMTGVGVFGGTDGCFGVGVGFGRSLDRKSLNKSSWSASWSALTIDDILHDMGDVHGA